MPTNRQQRKTLAAKTAQIRDLNRDLKAEREQNQNLTRMLGVREAIERSGGISWRSSTPKTTGAGRSGASFLACWSDWHWEERIEPATVNGINAFNQKVAENRAQKLFENTVRCWEVRDEDHGGFEEGVLWLGGDFISGDIHDELLESNWCSPSQALVHVYRVICAGIEYLTDKTQRPWRIVCSYGNHGRTTKRPRVSTAAENNLETILYTMLAERYPSVLVPSGALTYLTIQERTVRFHHGDHIRWQGGQSGLEGPINRAVDAWDRIITADLNVIGHWHRAVDFGSTIVNGSLVGYGPYSLKIKAAIEPPQQTFAVITKERGKVDFGRVWVT